MISWVYKDYCGNGEWQSESFKVKYSEHVSSIGGKFVVYKNMGKFPFKGKMLCRWASFTARFFQTLEEAKEFCEKVTE